MMVPWKVSRSTIAAQSLGSVKVRVHSLKDWLATRAELVDELVASSEAIASTIGTHPVDRFDASIAAPLSADQS